MHLSLNALETANYLSDTPLERQKAKLFWKSGYKDCALRILEIKYMNKTLTPLVRSEKPFSTQNADLTCLPLK